jgi:predicted SAM-dependent methyltransferase
MRMIRFLIEGSTKYICKFKRNSRVKTSPKEEVKINLGCGLAVAEGWFNVDGSLNALIASFPAFFHRTAYRATGANLYYSRDQYCDLLRKHRFVHHNLAYGIPFHDASVDFVYSSHFLEHLHKDEAFGLLREACRVLKRGGVIRISVPDLSYAVALYENGHTERMLEMYFFNDDSGSAFARHKYMYDFNLLKARLEAAGFEHVQRRAYLQGTTPDIDQLDNRSEDSLFVEAVKTS